MDLKTLNNNYKDIIAKAALENNIAEVFVFGSVATEKSNQESDIDLLVKMKPEAKAWDLGGFYSDISEAIGLKIDVVTEKSLHPFIRKQVLEQAKKIH